MENKVFFAAQTDYNQLEMDKTAERVFQTLLVEIAPESHVLIKPNLLAKHAPDKAVTTHPALVRAVIRALKKRGISRITVADSSGGVYTPAVMKSIGQASGLAQVCEQENVEFYTKCAFETVQTQGKMVRSFELLKPVVQADFIINLPKMKTHVMTNMTGGVKNLFGTIPGLKKAELHMRFPEKQRFGQMLCELCQTVAPSLTIMDAVTAMEGDGPAGGTPRHVGMILASRNVWNLDLAVCRLMGIAPQQVPYLNCAIQNNICEKEFSDRLCVGDVQQCRRIEGYRLPSNYVEMDFSNRFPPVLRPLAPVFVKLASPRPKVRAKKCVGCGKCAEICPAKTIQIADKKAKILPSDCIRCFCCHEMCPVKAIDVVRPLGALFNL